MDSGPFLLKRCAFQSYRSFWSDVAIVRNSAFTNTWFPIHEIPRERQRATGITTRVLLGMGKLHRWRVFAVIEEVRRR